MRLLFFFVILSKILFANITIDNSSKIIDTFTISYYNDTTGSLGINDIVKLDFNKTLPNAFSLNHTEGKDWFQITLHNNSDNEEFLLYSNDAWWYELNLYSFENSKLIKVENGLKVFLKDKKIKDTHPTLAFHIDKGKNKTLYIEGNALLGSVQKFIIYTNADLHLEHQLFSIGLYTFYMGAALVVVLLNLLLFFTIRERIYIYYALYVFTFTIIAMTIEGVFEYIFPGSFYSLHFLVAISLGLLILFSREILQTSKFSPKIDKVLIFFAIVIFILAPLIYIDPVKWLIPYNNLLPIPPLLILFSAITTRKNNTKEAAYYLIFMSFYVIGLFTYAVLILGLVPYTNFTRYVYIVSSFFEITLFSLVLANRFNTTRKEKYIIEGNLKKAQEFANHDTLTKLYNRHYLHSYLSVCFHRAKREQEEVSVIMLDIDHFKSVNDTYGHNVGDIVLKNIASVFINTTRKSDVVSRYGGEEFVIILANTKLEDAQILAEKIRSNVENMKSKYQENKELSITISLGISLLKEEDTSMQTVINRADKALYNSKSSGRNRVSVI